MAAPMTALAAVAQSSQCTGKAVGLVIRGDHSATISGCQLLPECLNESKVAAYAALVAAINARC